MLGLPKATELNKQLPKNAIYRIELNQARYTYPIRARAIAEALHCKVEDVFTVTEEA